jgi:hypothetical protein
MKFEPKWKLKKRLKKRTNEIHSLTKQPVCSKNTCAPLCT